MKQKKAIIKTHCNGVAAFFITEDIVKTKENINKMLREKLLNAYKEIKSYN